MNEDDDDRPVTRRVLESKLQQLKSQIDLERSERTLKWTRILSMVVLAIYVVILITTIVCHFHPS
jgi:hypothetical protein